MSIVNGESAGSDGACEGTNLAMFSRTGLDQLNPDRASFNLAAKGPSEFTKGTGFFKGISETIAQQEIS